MADEGFREIQLSGKQLISLFMAAAVVLVVTFLCGVFVGRGVRSHKDTTVVADVLPATAPGGTDPTAAVTATQPDPKAAAGSPPAAPPPNPPPDELSYYSRLDSATPPAEDTKPAAPKPADAPAKPAKEKDQKPVDTKPADAKPADAAKPAPAAADAAGGDQAGGWVVKVAAYKEKSQADALLAKLSGKGYTAFVVQLSGAKGAGLYSVRVGKFKTRKDAEATKHRLEQEQYKSLLISR